MYDSEWLILCLNLRLFPITFPLLSLHITVCDPSPYPITAFPYNEYEKSLLLEESLFEPSSLNVRIQTSRAITYLQHIIYEIPSYVIDVKICNLYTFTSF